MTSAARPAWIDASVKKLEGELVVRYGETSRSRLARGLGQVSSLWIESDGDATEFESFVRANFAGDEATYNTLLSRMDFLHGNPEAGPEGNAERAELKKLLAQEIAKLSERERLVITLYYFEHLTSKEIGKILGVSDSRISQLHTKAVLRLRGKLAKLRSILSD